MGTDPPALNNGGYDACPVEGVSWADIQEFLKKLNALTGKTYRLPSEAEWEYAARGGEQGAKDGYVYSGGNLLDDVGWYDNNSGGKTHPVGGKKPNQLGIYDMSGNVWEWCADWYDDYPSSAQPNPTGLGTGSNRVNRGGSWNNDAQNCRAANRNNNTPDNRNNNLGFRLALSLQSVG